MDAHTRRVMFSCDTVEWSTPEDLFQSRHAIHNFQLDAAATSDNAKCEAFITESMDAFQWPWLIDGRAARVWLNPPYCRKEKICRAKCRKKRCAKRGFHCAKYVPGLYQWVKLAHGWSQKGCLVELLLPAKMGSDWWHEFVWAGNGPRPGVEVTPLRGRLKFGGSKNSAPFDSVLVTFRLTCTFSMPDTADTSANG